MNLHKIYFIIGILAISGLILISIVYLPSGITGQATIDLTATVANTPPTLNISNITINEGDILNFTDLVYDPNLDPISIKYSGDANGSNYWITDYLDAGSYNLTVNVSDGLNSTIYNFSVTIQDVVCTLFADINSDQQSVDLEWSLFVGNSTYSNFSIYYDSTLSSGFVNTASATNTSTLSNTWTDTTANLANRRYYNIYGNNGSDTILCPITVGKLDLNMTSDNEGWYMIANPFTPKNNSRNEVLRNVLGNIEIIYHYNTTSGNWNYWNFTSSQGSIHNMTPGTSYTIRTFDNITLTFVGSLFNLIDLSLTSNFDGWNPLGWVHEETDRTIVFAGINNSINWIFDYNSSSANWNYIYNPYSLGNIDNMTLGEGYLIKMNQNDVLSYEIT